MAMPVKTLNFWGIIYKLFLQKQSDASKYFEKLIFNLILYLKDKRHSNIPILDWGACIHTRYTWA
jgi:hypothetical protein